MKKNRLVHSLMTNLKSRYKKDLILKYAFKNILEDTVVSPAKYQKDTTLLIQNEQMSFLTILKKENGPVKF